MRIILPFLRPKDVPNAESPELPDAAEVTRVCEMAMRDWCPQAADAGSSWLEDPDRSELERHARDCPPCAAELVLVEAFAAGRSGKRAARTAMPARWRVAGLAAAAVLAVVALQPAWLTPPNFPDRTEIGLVRAATIDLVSAGGEVSWPAIAGAAAYRVTTVGLVGEVLRIEQPAERAFRPDPAEMMVVVEALGSDGLVVARGSIPIPPS